MRLDISLFPWAKMDGFLALFYKHYWETVGDQIVSATQSFSEMEGCLKSLTRPSSL